MWPALRQLLRRHQPGIVAGVLVGTSYIPFPPWAVLCCWVPLWRLLERPLSWREAFRQAWVSQCVLSLIGFHWIAPTAREFGGLPWPAAVGVLLAFAAVMHLFIPIGFALAARLATRWRLGVPCALALAALLHAAGERVWPMLFPWHLGYTLLWARIPAFQWADTIGFQGLSTLVLLANAWVAWLWIRHRQRHPVGRELLLLAGALLLVTGTGHLKGVRARPRPEDPRAELLAVQANIGGAARRRIGRGHADTAFAAFLRLTEEGLRGARGAAVDAIVWPEAAFPRNVGAPLPTHGMPGEVVTAIARWGRPLLTGGYLIGDSAVFNALAVLTASGRGSDPPYRKSLLLPFGEYLPGRGVFPWLSALFPAVRDFGRGDGPRVLALPLRGDTLTVGPQICYEGLFPAFSRQLGAQGAQLLVNVANDSWFGDSFEVHQHLVMTLARGIELRRPVVRATNTGITTAMDASGRLYGHSPLNAAWHGHFVIPYQLAPAPTVWQRVGHRDWVLWGLLLAAILLRGARQAPARTPTMEA